MTKTAEYVQDQSTNNVHLRGADRADRPEDPATALCNKRYRVFTYASAESQANLAWQFNSWGECPRCVAKAERG